MSGKSKMPALGRGLDALISSEEPIIGGSTSVGEIDIDRIDANPNQPRREFDDVALDELAESIKQIGIIQPITLREMPGGRYQIIAGERRWRAGQRAGLKTIPAYIRTADDENMMQMALVENIQREDLNAIEIALAYKNLIDVCHLTQEQLAERVGKKRTTIANFLRLLKLPAQVQVALKNHEVDNGHARALLSLDKPSEQVKLFREIKAKGYSVRQVEELVSAMKQAVADEDPAAKSKTASGRVKLPEEYKMLTSKLSDFFKTKVQMTRSARGKGKISITFDSDDELERLVALLDEIRH
ncbi:MAG: ParB/RepB/Spo0J family partition protein [Alloprevotella sp.]|nr:ParB/RepB/Spo0J family partition protein [Alloprevotella sp.]MDY4567659.1 ParB/RepB/Spo0J family partition protein [Alloprevotella sp.]MDY6113935.1 ParB/RepB/Spo0J family partition protein [Alloprevotella sp.]